MSSDDSRVARFLIATVAIVIVLVVSIAVHSARDTTLARYKVCAHARDVASCVHNP